ncbi:hypothetical protein WN51_12771 [Melipona quadrifasciata]|uniref:Uncharacterized protein n=1 Tax=Melipona quadrifasciata TaxID=166423 RepID=A0A0N0U5P6_9HYME|nr:hypothetical protein WN51_12771 [Melipona quadrifasciata]
MMIDGFVKTLHDRISDAPGRLTLLALHRNPRATPNAKEKSDTAPFADIFPAKYLKHRIQYSKKDRRNVFYNNLSMNSRRENKKKGKCIKKSSNVDKRRKIRKEISLLQHR